jgi:ketosteroid isomerase-like protein
MADRPAGAKVRRDHGRTMPQDEHDILAANAAFYRAFADRDADAMDALWARRTDVACIHPGWQALHGREEVMASWRAILDSPDAPDIEFSLAHVYASAEMAFVVCTESLADGRLTATNVFVREAEAWRLVHHHAGPIARTRDAEGGDEPPPLLN